jgi:DNA-directed RNA polymerase subunit RPC12/RpoP
VTAPRYRCSACGNLTRFDVTVTRQTRAFHHYSLGGALHVEEDEILAERVDEVSCRWCGHGRAVEALRESEETEV